MSGKKQSEYDLIEWRRGEELQLYASGKSLTQIAEIMKVAISTVSRDLDHIRATSKEKQAQYIELELPFRHKLRAAAMDKAIKELWGLFYAESDGRAKKSILDSITEALLKQAAIDGDPMVIEKTIKLVGKVRANLANSEQYGNEKAESPASLQEGPVG